MGAARAGGLSVAYSTELTRPVPRFTALSVARTLDQTLALTHSLCNRLLGGSAAGESPLRLVRPEWP